MSYGVSLNRQNPFAGAGHDAIFNTFRRVSSQIFYWGPAVAAGYYVTNWAIERYVHLLTPQSQGVGMTLMRG